MAEVLLFHHALGVTPGVLALADALRAAQHTVHVPDLYGGRTFATVEEGVAHAQEIGFGTIADRGVAVAEELPQGLVYVGWSLGAVPAQHLTQTRDGARGAVLLEACLPHDELGSWPGGVPAQVHGMDADPFFTEEGGDLDSARALVEAVPDVELFVYPGDQHLFLDASLPTHRPEPARLAISRVLDFLHDLG